MSNLTTSADRPTDNGAVVSRLSKLASVPEAGARLHLDHAAFEASLERLHDFVLADDAELVQDEWNELEEAILRHLDAEEMFLLPGFARAAPEEAAMLHSEHTELREQLGAIDLALDLHTVRAEQIDRLFRAIASHTAREERTLYPWAEVAGNSTLLDAVARRLPHPRKDGSQEARTTTTLLSLLKVCRDGEQGYRRAALDADDVAHRTLFAQLADERGRFGRHLRDELKRLGVNAQFKGTIFGAFHRGWIEASSRLAHGKAKLILRECERGEELATRAYRGALRTDLPASIRESVGAQSTALERALEDVRALSAGMR